MTETYTRVGMDPSWVIALMPVPAIVGVTRARWKTRQTPIFTWLMGVIMAYCLLGSWIGVPVEWMFAGMSIGAGINCIILRHQLLVRYAGAAFAALFFGFGAVVLPWRSLKDRQIILSDAEVTFTKDSKSKSFPRNRLKMSVFPSTSFYYIHPEGSWILTFSDIGNEYAEGELSEIYWEPRGFVTSYDLGIRIAHWADIVPMVPTFHTDVRPATVTCSPLPGFDANKKDH